MRGDRAEAELWTRALDLVRLHQIESDADTGPLFDNPPPDSDPDVLARLRQMYEAGGWVLVESAVADLPADLRWQAQHHHKYLSDQELEEFILQQIKDECKDLSSYKRPRKVVIRYEEFEKTSTMKIKRYLYNL